LTYRFDISTSLIPLSFALLGLSKARPHRLEPPQFPSSRKQV
jgi:hypothetical protein